jgi:aldose sugar dehydrogenase
MADPSTNWWVFPGFEIETVLSGLDLPANIAFVRHPGPLPDDPLLYINGLYGTVTVMKNNGETAVYAAGLLNYEPDHKFPGTGESGLTGLCVEPATGDLFLSMLYFDDSQVKARVIRTHSADGGLTMESYDTVVYDVPSIKAAHQVQACTIGPDGKLYVNFGDGMIDPSTAQKDEDWRGKILRLELDGTVPDDNPTPASPVYAKGVRNPFGAVWRRSDGNLYISDNGPHVDDRICRVSPGQNMGWPNDLRQNAIMWWNFCQAPTALDFMQDGQFSEIFEDELFVAVFGSAYVMGPTHKGKKIAKMRLDDTGDGIKSYDEFVSYTGKGPASCCGLAFGPDGLYFTDLHGEFSRDGGKSYGHLFRIKEMT